jgi:A/G-specific adenine glycosylase
MLFVLRDRRVLLQRRPPRGIWGGLWAPPEFPEADAALAWATARFAKSASRAKRLPVVHHAFTHFDLDIEPWVLEIGGAAREIAESDTRWHELAALHAVGLPAPVAKLLKECRDGQDGSMREARPRGPRSRTPAVSG